LHETNLNLDENLLNEALKYAMLLTNRKYGLLEF